MSTIVNARYLLLQATVPRLLVPVNAAVILSASAPAFHVAVGGANDPASISFRATLISIDGTVTFSATGATLTSISGNTATLLYANMSSATAVVTATITYRGQVFTSSVNITKVLDGANGANGSNGARGNVNLSAVTTGTSWSDSEANAALVAAGYGAPQIKDIVTLVNAGASFVATKIYTGSVWTTLAAFFDGSLLVNGTIYTDALAANAVTASKISVTNLQAVSAIIGTLRTATSGARTEIADNVIKLYDASNIKRIHIGDSSL